MAIKKLIFVDTNIWLDFYRARSEAGLALLRHLEAIGGSIITTHQLESEFKKNRQVAILEGIEQLKPPQQLSRPGILSESKSTKVLQKSLKEAEKRVKELRGRLARVLDDPSQNDIVYQTFQRIIHRDGDLGLTRENPLRRRIRSQAFRRFLHGCPPRKKTDTSIGDALNWEWMVHCALAKNAELVIVSRDPD